MHDGAVSMPKRAMVLAAGLGLRMRPITDTLPKALVTVSGRTLLDRAIDRFERAGVERVVVNSHHKAERIRQHLRKRQSPEIVIVHEDELLETGGGVKNALEHLGTAPFFVANADAMWLNGPTSTLERMARAFDPKTMDALLLLHSTVEAYGYNGVGDFLVDPLGHVTRRPEMEVAPYLFTGVQILSPGCFEGTPDGRFSLNVVYDRLIEAGRLAAVVHDGEWFHIGTPDGLAEAEAYMQVRYPGIRRR